MFRRGINYDVGTQTGPYTSRPVFDTAQTRHDLTVIRDQLHCDSVRISGTSQERLLTATELALDLGLEAWLSPHLHDGDSSSPSPRRHCRIARNRLAISTWLHTAWSSVTRMASGSPSGCFTRWPSTTPCGDDSRFAA